MILTRGALVGLGLLLCTAWTCCLYGQEQGRSVVFKSATEAAGIEFTHTFGDSEMSSILEATGPGCALFDYDSDGHIDLYLVNGNRVAGIHAAAESADGDRPTNKLFRNNGDGTFSDVTQSAGVGDTGYGMGAVAADYDNDGHIDLYVCNYGHNRLYRNNGDGTFSDLAEHAGVVCPEWSVHAAFFDYDRDGLLDLYVGNYLDFDPEYRIFFGPEGFPGPLAYAGVPDRLFRNNGDGTFSDRTKAAGLWMPDGRAMSVTTCDFDHDGDSDVFVANDAMENYLFANDGKGSFTNVAFEIGVALGTFGEATSSMGPTFADIDNDEDFDLFIPDMGYCCLYRNDGILFTEITTLAGISEVCGQYTSWAGAVFDYDNDGFRDIFISNGDAHHTYAEEDLLLRNRRDGTFEDVSLQSGAYFQHTEYIGRGAAVGDFDNDGDQDLFVVNVNGPAILLRNDGGNAANWIRLRTVGTQGNRDGIGARIKVVAGGLTQVAEVRSGSNYLSQDDMRPFFGLADHAVVDLIEVEWPSGARQRLEGVAAKQTLVLTEPSAIAEPVQVPTSGGVSHEANGRTE